MEQEIFGAQQEFQMSMQCQLSPEESYYNEVIDVLQEVIIDQQFQKKQNAFMSDKVGDLPLYQSLSQKEYEQYAHNLSILFENYQIEITSIIVQRIAEKVSQFDIRYFFVRLQSHKDKIDPILYELIAASVNFQDFKIYFEDYKKAIEEQERYRVLTVKANKISQNKKVKGNSENIFANSNKQLFGNKPKKQNMKQKQICDKNQYQLLVPETVLTVKGLRKC